MDPVDAEAITSALVKKLSVRETNFSPIKVGYLTLLTDYTIHVTALSGFPHWRRIFEAGFHRLWNEICLNSQSPTKGFLEHITSFASVLLYSTS